ncbi:hypothetical protein WDZ92_02670 [Nostoc sp. NIES-2111]
MDYNEQQESLFLMGFNHGYFLEQYEPKLTKVLVQGLPDPGIPYTDGLKHGSKQFQKERFKDQARQTLNDSQSLEQDEGFDLSR